MSLPCGAVYGWGVREGTMHLLGTQLAFSNFPCYAQAIWILLVLVPRWVVLCTFLDPVVSPTNSPVRLWVFPTAATPIYFYSQRFRGFISPCWNPGLHGLSYSPVVPPGLSACKCGMACSTSCHLAWKGPPVATLPQVCSTLAACLQPFYQSEWLFLPQLFGCQIFIHLDFLAVLVVFLFLNLLLPSFWLYEKLVYNSILA